MASETDSPTKRLVLVRVLPLVLLALVAFPRLLRGNSYYRDYIEAEWTDSWEADGCHCAEVDRDRRVCEFTGTGSDVEWEPVDIHGDYELQAGRFALFVSPEPVDRSDVRQAAVGLWHGMEPGDYDSRLGYLVISDGFAFPEDKTVSMNLHAGEDLCGGDGQYHLVSYMEGAQEWDIDLHFRVWHLVEEEDSCFSCSGSYSGWDDDDTSWDDDDTGDDDDTSWDDDTEPDDDTADDDSAQGDDDSASDDDSA